MSKTLPASKRCYKVYCLLFPNGKRYIGSTKLSMAKRIFRAKYEQHPEMKDQIRSKNICYPVKCLETGIIYPSASNCEKEMSVAHAGILSVCRHKQRHAGGYSFAFA